MRREVVSGLALALLVLLTAVAAPGARAASPDATAQSDPVMLVVDTSGSMGDSDATGRVKIEGAKVALLDFLKTVAPGTPLGLRTYPAQSGGCDTGRVRFAIKPRDPAEMAAEIRTLSADGDTPTAEALRAAAQQLRDTGAQRGTLILVSDGESTCQPPCDVAKQIAREGIALQTITVGFQISSAGRKELQCIADATDGEYVDASQSDKLAQVFDRISAPRLDVRLDYPAEAVAEAGNDPSGAVRVTARIRNSGGRRADNVVARFRFDAGAIGTPHPIRSLGNLESGQEETVSWLFRPSVLLTGQSVRFTVLARAVNGMDDASVSGETRILDASDKASAGPILKRPGELAILGDSYSAGEGASSFVPQTDTSRNHCHRSPHTYLVEERTFGLSTDDILACSGAVINDIFHRNEGNNVESQVDQLAGFQAKGHNVSALVMTLGGNDAGFRTVAEACVFHDCSKTISDTPSDQFLREHTDPLPQRLSDAYAAVDGVLNAADAVGRRRTSAPILVLGYPLPVRVARTRVRPGRFPCISELRVHAEEARYITLLVTTLNAKIEAGVNAARERGVPVFYVPTTEEAFLPDHTICDLKPFARRLNSIHPAGIDWSQVLREGRRNARYPLELTVPKVEAAVAWDAFERTIQQLFHPNDDGYHAETGAIVRWSRSEAAKRAVALLAADQPPPPQRTSWPRSEVDLGQLGPDRTPALEGGTSYPVTGSGFAPASSVQIQAHSDLRALGQTTADAAGRIATRVSIPDDLAGGSHTLELLGAGRDGGTRRLVVPFRIAEGGGISAMSIALLGGGVLWALAILMGALALFRGRRRGLAPV